MELSLKIRAHSEIGLVRSNNQDSAYTSPSLIVVADGMGGAAAGDLASSVAIRELRQADEQNRPGPNNPAAVRLAGDQLLEVLGGALAKANDALADLVAWDRALDGMGTTVCAVMFSGSQYGICHIGDSRAYLLRAGEFRRLTHDHSWVQSLVDEGKISEEQAATHPHRSLLLKVLNGQPSHAPDFDLVDAQLGDRLLLCTDGLSGMVDDEDIEKLLTGGNDLAKIVAELTSAAHKGGGLDNITLVVADVVEQDESLAATPPQVLGAAAAVAIPRVDGPRPGEHTEDTHRIAPGARTKAITGQEAVPGLPAGVIDPDRFETIRYTPQLASRRRRWLPILISIAIVLVVLLAGFLGGRAYVASQFFIGPDGERVAVYQGVPDQILGQHLWTRIETSTTRVTDLPAYYAGKVRDRDLRYTSADQAHEQLANLGRMAERCVAERAAAAASAPPPTSTPSDGEPASPGTSQAAPVSPQSSGVAVSTASITPGQTANPSSPGTSRPDLEACG